MFDQHIKN